MNQSALMLTREVTKRGRKNAHSHGRALRNPVAPPSLLTDKRFMSRPQREAFNKGEEIWV